MQKILNFNLKSFTTRQLSISVKGFTLIELLIVIAIIGILSSFLISNYVGVRERARDAQRKSDVRQIQASLELYRSDNRQYPAAANAVGACGSSLQSATVPPISYMRAIPCDPSAPNYYNDGNYYYSSDGTEYVLGACLEVSSDNTAEVTATDPSSLGGCASGKYFVVYNP